ncbi:hypothetical protein KI387_008329, partial [Taxus chinensis]
DQTITFHDFNSTGAVKIFINFTYIQGSSRKREITSSNQAVSIQLRTRPYSDTENITFHNFSSTGTVKDSKHLPISHISKYLPGKEKLPAPTR